MLKRLDLRADAPWKQRLRAPTISATSRASQNPARGLAISNKSGVVQLYAWNTETGELAQLTDDPAGVGDGAISVDGEHIYYLRDRRGDEIGHYARIPFGGGEAQDLTPDLPEYASHFLAESASGSALGFFAADAQGFHFYVYNLTNMESPDFALSKQALAFGPLLSQDGEIAIIASSEKTGSAEYALEAYDVESGEIIAELWDGAGSGIVPGEFSPAPADMRFAGSSSADGYHRPFIWNPLTGERHDIESAQFQGDVKFMNWSPDGGRLLLHQISGAKHALYAYDIAGKRARLLDLPDGVPYKGSGFLPNGAIEIHFDHSSAPPRLVELDGETGAIKRDVIDLGVTVPAGTAWRSVSYESTKGARIQAWLATPPGAGPFPTIVHTHGGPTAVMVNRWAPDAQVWLDHGFAFFSLNYRGSTTFGYDFQHAIDGNLGELEVEDIAAGVQWLIDRGIAKSDAILKTGVSYGGYLTLLALGKKPALWAGGMAEVAIADWTLMYEDQAETLRGYQRGLFGGTPDEKAEAHRKASPITYAEEIQAPILVLQGANDTRCPARQMRVYEARLKELGKSIEVHWFDAGHGSLDNEELVEKKEKLLRFAYRVLDAPGETLGGATKIDLAKGLVKSVADRAMRRPLQSSEGVGEATQAEEGDSEDNSRSRQFAESAIKAALKLPGSRVDRERFLREQLQPYCRAEQVREAISTRPAEARIPKDLIDRLADSVINSHSVKAASLAFVAGLPPGPARLLTIPADTAQFVWHAIVLAQKLAYLYGWPDLMEEDNPDEKTELRMLLLIGCMLGIESANRIQGELAIQFASQVGRRLPRQALTQTAYYPVFKEVLKWFGVRLTKQTFADGVAAVIPIVGVGVGAGVAFFTLRPMARQLKNHLRGLRYAEPPDQDPPESDDN